MKLKSDLKRIVESIQNEISKSKEFIKSVKFVKGIITVKMADNSIIKMFEANNTTITSRGKDYTYNNGEILMEKGDEYYVFENIYWIFGSTGKKYFGTELIDLDTEEQSRKVINVIDNNLPNMVSSLSLKDIDFRLNVMTYLTDNYNISKYREELLKLDKIEKISKMIEKSTSDTNKEEALEFIYQFI